MIGIDPDVLRAMAVDLQRRIVASLTDADGRASRFGLVTQVAARQFGVDVSSVTANQQEQLQLQLRHTSLPALADAGLVEYDDEMVTLLEHPALDHPLIRTLIEHPGNDEQLPSNEVLVALADARRQSVLEILLDHQRDPLSVEDISLILTSREQDETLVEVDESDRRAVERTLYHIHLPKLDVAGLVSYDETEQLVAAGANPPLEAVGGDEELSGLQYLLPHVDEPQPADRSLWTIQGAENVAGRAQALFDAADDELFMLLTTTALLEGDSLPLLRDALDRDVDVCIGTRTQAVRDRVREALPETLVWEPQFDFLSLPPEQETVGRLVLADREAVLLGTLCEAADGDPESVQAITSEGADEPLVVLVQQLLGSRLDHLDEQSPDFRSQLQI